MHDTPTRILAGLFVAGFAATASTDALAQETLQAGATFLASGVDPARGSNGWSLVSHGIGEKLFMVDAQGRLVPELAERAERLDELTWRVELTQGRYFSDGSPVTAAALAEGFANTFEHNATARSTGGMLEFVAIDDHTLEVVTERPVAYIEALFAEWPLIAYTLDDAGEAVFTGPYAVGAFHADDRVELVANPHFEGAEARSDLTLRRFGDAQTMALAFEAGELDLAFGLPSEMAPRLAAQPDIDVKTFTVGYQYMAILNLERPGLQDVVVRQAIDLAIDREQLVAAINGGTPASGAFAPYFAFAPTEPRQTDRQAAADMLAEAGFEAGSDGVLEREGERLSVRVLAYPQRPDLVTMLPVVRAHLTDLGFEVDTRVVENVSEAAAEGDFDIFLWAQHTAPSGDPAFYFTSMLRSGGAINHSRYADPEFDAILDELVEASDAELRAELALDAQARLFETVPVVYLVAPEWHVGVSERLAGYEPWGSDYHVLRADIGESR
ncbi:MAG: ABC transporter substrate-binding protein [Rhizobiaceae bacterium]